MPDLAYDAAIISEGNKGLFLTMQQMKYGGMNAGKSERRHEMGGFIDENGEVMHHDSAKELYDFYPPANKNDFFAAYLYLRYPEHFIYHASLAPDSSHPGG